jgi:hypothetical protein
MRRRFEGWNKWNCSADSDILCRCQTERQTDRRGRQTVCIMMMHTHTHTHTHINVSAYLGVCMLARVSGFPNHITRPGNTKNGCAQLHFIRVTTSRISPATTDPTPEGGRGRGRSRRRRHC